MINGSGIPNLLTLENAHTNDFAALLRSRRWQRLELQSFRFSEAGGAQAVLQSLVACPGLEDLCLLALGILNGDKEFYVQLGNALPDVIGLETFRCSFLPGSISDADCDECVSAILRGACLAPNFKELWTPPCQWTSPLVASLVDSLRTTQSMTKLVVHGTVESNQSMPFAI